MAKKTTSRVVTLEEAAENSLRMVRDDFSIYNPTEERPTIIYEIGSRVIHGNCFESTVIETLDNDRILKLYERLEPGRDDRPREDGYVHRIIYVSWYDVQPYLSLNQRCMRPRFSIDNLAHINFMNSTVSGLISRHHHFGVDFEPEYQRGHVWTLDDKVNLIHSLLHGIDIGKFTFVQLPFQPMSPSYEILDGKQRLTALIEFVEGRFTYQGHTFFELHPTDQRTIENAGVLAATLPESTTLAQKYEYFLRLNTAGRIMSKEHLENIGERLKNMKADV